MIDRVRRQSALLVLLRAWRNFGQHAFAVDRRGAHWDALRDAEKLGWCSFVDDRCRLTAAGVEQLAPWRGAHGEAAD